MSKVETPDMLCGGEEFEYSLLQETSKVRTLEGVPIYRGCDISLQKLSTEDVYPTARYVLSRNLQILEYLRQVIKKEDSKDIFDLSEIVKKGNIKIGPPVVEWSSLDQCNLIVDGHHRFWLARQLGVGVNALYIKGVNPDIPVLSMPVKWEEVNLCDSRPEVSSDRRILREGINLSDKEIYFRDLSFLGSSGPR